eukprot:243970-Pleurochrysis_carterae.AAC.3
MRTARPLTRFGVGGRSVIQKEALTAADTDEVAGAAWEAASIRKRGEEDGKAALTWCCVGNFVLAQRALPLGSAHAS